MEEEIRLQKYMAQCGVASRRHAEDLIREGRVKVNGAVVTEMGYKITGKDRVECDNVIIKPEEEQVYIMLNKPSGYVTTVTDPEGRATVMNLVKGVNERIYPVGRLDYDTTGLIILTNDGDFAFKSTHPGKQTKKTYQTEVMGIPSNAALEKLRTGVLLDERMTSKARVDVVEIKLNSAVLEITIHEGRNHQVKRMCEAVGHPVLRLKRTAVGGLKLGELKPGEWRYLNEQEIRLIL